jgi:hypothetical protein
MYLGFFGFPNKLDYNIIDVVQFDQSGLYVIPDNVRTILVYAVGGGGGGGGGGRRAAGTASVGGGGGSGGAQFYGFLPDAILVPGATIEVTIGTGGGGGAPGANTSNGSAGSAGGNTTLTFYGGEDTNFPFLSLLGGGQGFGGSSTTAIGGTARTSIWNGVSLTNFGGGAGGAAPASTSVLTTQYNGGGGGGGVNASNVTGAGASLIKATINTTNTSGCSDPTVAEGLTFYGGGSINSMIPGESSRGHIFTAFSSGFGGAGGGGATAGTGAGDGGLGYRGGGGGGGGASRNGITAGRGGTGGNGYAIFVAIK